MPVCSLIPLHPLKTFHSDQEVLLSFECLNQKPCVIVPYMHEIVLRQTFCTMVHIHGDRLPLNFFVLYRYIDLIFKTT
jgi:hypothetical protein